MSSTPPTGAPPPVGRPAVDEFAELLLLRRRPALAAIVVVVLLGLAVSAVAPGVVSPGPVAGLLVGLLALLVAAVAMVATDAVDPVVRGPRHLRVTGRTVVARAGDPPSAEDLQPAVDGVVAALELVRHLRVVVVGIEHDPGPVAALLARGVAAAGRSALLVDLTDDRAAPGISDITEGVALADVVTIQPGVRLARIGAGADPVAAATAAALLAATPPSDLDLLVTAVPGNGRPAADLLIHTERVLAVVPLGRHQRDDVDRRLAQVEGSRSARASVVVVDVDAAPTDAPPAPQPEPAPPVPEPVDIEPVDVAPEPVDIEPDDVEPVDVEPDGPESDDIEVVIDDEPEPDNEPDTEPETEPSGSPADVVVAGPDDTTEFPSPLVPEDPSRAALRTTAALEVLADDDTSDDTSGGAGGD
jgi:hypothetical protein